MGANDTASRGEGGAFRGYGRRLTGVRRRGGRSRSPIHHGEGGRIVASAADIKHLHKSKIEMCVRKKMADHDVKQIHLEVCVLYEAMNKGNLVNFIYEAESMSK